MVEKLAPDLNHPQLFQYFRITLQSLLPDLGPEALERGMSCVASARLIVMEMGGPTQARSYWVEKDIHQFVVKNGQTDDELAYNNTCGQKRHVWYVKKYGVDTTEEDLAAPIEQLVTN